MASNQDWSALYKPAERNSSVDLVEITHSMQWFMYSVSGLLAICLFIAAGHRQKQGDITGSCLSIIGAVLCALAPILAKTFLLGSS